MKEKGDRHNNMTNPRLQSGGNGCGCLSECGCDELRVTHHVSRITPDSSLVTRHSSLVLIVGSGAAALAAALNLWERGVKDILIVTEKWGGGTSNNAGKACH